MTSRVLFRAKRLLQESAGMGPVLGLDTSGPIAALGLVGGGKVLAETTYCAVSHGTGLAEAVDAMMVGAGLGFRDLRGIAVGIGPGSFTGLRVGLSYVKGLGTALGCAVAGVRTFHSVALAAAAESAGAAAGTLICLIVDARRGEVYAALYRLADDGVETLSEALLVRLEDLVRKLSSDVILVGDVKALEAHAQLRARGHKTIFLESDKLNSRGQCVAALGAERLSRGEADSPAALEPLYVRTAEATFKPLATAADSAAAAKEGPWSVETKSSSSNI